MIDKNAAPTKLLWLDLEMTGLDPKEDFILEVSAEVTDFEFKTLASYDARVQYTKSEPVIKRFQANAWWQEFPENRDQFIAGLAHGKPLAAIEHELVRLVEDNFGLEPAVLAGNSIHNDRGFIKQWLPKFDLKLHYRMLDVSSFKLLMQGKYGVVYDKADVHRAYEDTQASIAELQHYLEWFASHGPQDR